MEITCLITLNDHRSAHFVLDEPSECPVCKYAIKPQRLSAELYPDDTDQGGLAVIYLCKHCNHPFLANYRVYDDPYRSARINTRLLSVAPRTPVPRAFEKCIQSLSPSFVEIYNQALAAESHGLDQICGVGYRKAFEYLIKDYLLSQTEDEAEKEKIRVSNLGLCISQKVTNERLKTTASRCTWLGNDQTHYEKLFTEYDIKDLKRLIDVSVHWVSMELLTDEAAQMEPRSR